MVQASLSVTGFYCQAPNFFIRKLKKIDYIVYKRIFLATIPMIGEGMKVTQKPIFCTAPI